MTARLPRDLRSDARDNRDRILRAARSAFVTDGLDVPIREIARRAEVGPATVYRHFPTKEMLATEVFTDQVLAWRSIIDEGLAAHDPWHGFRVAVERLCELRARDHGFTAASRRFAALMIQAFQASPASSPLPPVPQLTPAVSAPRHEQQAAPSRRTGTSRQRSRPGWG